MSENDKKPPIITIRPIGVECKVIALLEHDGKVVDNVAAMEQVMEFNFNHGTTIEVVVERAKTALEQKYRGGGG